MVEAEFFLELLVRLLADPARLDCRGQCLEIGVGRQVGEIVFLLAGRAPLADEPDLFAGHMLHALVADPLRRPVGDAHADGGEAGLQGSLGFPAPGERAPFRLGEHVFSADGEDIGEMPFARPAAWGDGENEFDVAWVDLLMTGDADRPGKPACAQRLTELGAHAVPCVGEDCPEANAGGDQAIEFGERNLRLGPRRAIFGGHAGALEPSFVAGPDLRQEQPTIAGTSTRASVSDTKV